MIYKICQLNDLEKITELVYAKNNTEEHHIPYCCKNTENIYKDFENMINGERNLVVAAWDEDKLCGVLGIYCIDEINRVDNIGPFIDCNNENIQGNAKTCFINTAKDLVTLARNEFPTHDFSFDINAKNVNCLELMDTLGSNLNDTELHLSLKRDNFVDVYEESLAISYKTEYEEQLRNLHDEISGDYYLTSNQLLETIGNEREAYLIIENNRVVSYGVLQFSANTDKEVFIEILGVDKDYRGKGYGRMIQSHLISKAFERKSVEEVNLVVDDINSVALNLYESFGFECTQKSCSFTLRANN